MAKTLALDEFVSIANEDTATRGTFADAVVAIPYEKGSLTLYDKPVYIDAELGGVGNFGPIKSDLAELYSAGGWAGPIFNDSVGHELRCLAGKPDSSQQIGSTGVYEHTFENKEGAEHDSMSVTTKEANENLGYPFYMIDTWNLEWGKAQYVKRTVEGMGRSSEGKTTSNPAAVDVSQMFLPNMVSVKLAADTAGLSSATNIKSISGNLNFSKNVALQYITGRADKNPDDINNGEVMVEGSIELFMENPTERAKVFGNTPQAIEVNMATGTGSTLQGLKFTLNVSVLNDFEKLRSDHTRQRINFKVNRPALGTEPYEIVLTNRRANAY